MCSFFENQFSKNDFTAIFLGCIFLCIMSEIISKAEGLV